MSLKPVCTTLPAFLRANGFNLGSLTGQDAAALAAAVQIVHCYNHCDSIAEPHLLTAFRCVVMTMLPHNRRLAYHAIAHVTDWHFRSVWWQRAELPAVENPGRATNE